MVANWLHFVWRDDLIYRIFDCCMTKQIYWTHRNLICFDVRPFTSFPWHIKVVACLKPKLDSELFHVHLNLHTVIATKINKKYIAIIYHHCSLKWCILWYYQFIKCIAMSRWTWYVHVTVISLTRIAAQLAGKRCRYHSYVQATEQELGYNFISFILGLCPFQSSMEILKGEHSTNIHLITLSDKICHE